jgi:ATP-binding cassette, subfamily B (MDR/TAP), member 1
VHVLRNVNLTIEPRTYVAFVGASRCGKSTAIRLIERFYDPFSGHIQLDVQDISKLNAPEYRKYVSLVSQEPMLYAGTTKFNILFGAV